MHVFNVGSDLHFDGRIIVYWGKMIIISINYKTNEYVIFPRFQAKYFELYPTPSLLTNIQYAALRMGHQFLPFFYMKSWSNLTPNGSFKICSSWRFQSTPYMLNLMKFWLRYLRLKTIDIFQKIISFHLFHCQLSPLFLHQI